MRNAFLTTALLSVAVLSLLPTESNAQKKQPSMKIETPKAAQKPKEMVEHGHKRIDNYFWLNDRENPEVIQYLELENKYTDQMLSHTKELQDQLFKEMKGRIKEQDQSVPYFYNGYTYYTRFVEGGEYPIYCRKKGKNEGAEEVLLDCNEMAKGHEYFSATSMEVSPNNQLGMFAVDTVGRRKYTLMFKNLLTGELLGDRISDVSGNAEWANDNKTVFYDVKDPVTLREYKIMRHELGTPVSSDQVAYEEKDETFSCYVGKTKSHKYLVIFSGSTLTSENLVLEADNPSGKFRVFEPRSRKHEYSIDHLNGEFFIMTNDQAQNFRLMKCDEQNTSIKNWQEVIAHRSDVFLEGLDLFNGFYVVSERIGGLPRIRIIQNNGSEHYLDFGEAAYDAYMGANPEADTKVIRYGFNSMVTPASTFDYHIETKTKTLLKQQEIVGGYDASKYHSERINVKVRDGVMVPVSLVYRKDLFKKDGSNPLLQYAYGSYGFSMEATFSSARLSLLDRGFVYAIAHIRGGQEMGRQWYEDGKLLKKKNTFYDYIDCSTFLVEQKYTSYEKLFAMGGSAGGLLMGAVINMAPEKYKGVVAAVPFVDVITTMLDASIPLTTSEYDEWGNPEDKTYYDYMLSYSPYDNVEAKAYPNMLVTTGLHDSQVQYWEPAKWVAKLREIKKGDQMLLLYTNMDAGHGGASGRFKMLKELAMEYAFMIDLSVK
ncbi:MAG: S9 family peptidase [Bacteroidota bacterium]